MQVTFPVYIHRLHRTLNAVPICSCPIVLAHLQGVRQYLLTLVIDNMTVIGLDTPACPDGM